MRSKNSHQGFTLIELLVVVAIIVILMAILIPALGLAKRRAQVAATSALESQLRGAIDTYYSTFNAYPGPGSPSDTAGHGGKPKFMSGAQNLLLGLSYAVGPSGTLNIPFASGAGHVSPTPAGPGTGPNGPINYAAANPLFPGQGQQLQPFFAVSPKNIGPPSNGPWPAGGISGGAGSGNSFNFPVIVDAFSDGLPILYYRRTPGVDSSIADNPGDGYDSTRPGSLQAFYGLENAEYTGSAGTPPQLLATSGSVFPQRVATPYMTGQTLANYNCTGNYSTTPPTGVPVHGGYMLISAGIDRTYGLPANSKASDDLVLIGGD